MEKFFYLQQSFLPAFLAFLIAKNATNPIKPKPTIISIINSHFYKFFSTKACSYFKDSTLISLILKWPVPESFIPTLPGSGS